MAENNILIHILSVASPEKRFRMIWGRNCYQRLLLLFLFGMESSISIAFPIFRIIHFLLIFNEFHREF